MLLNKRARNATTLFPLQDADRDNAVADRAAADLGIRPQVFGDQYHLTSAFVAINANLPSEVIQHCLGTMITGIVGFQGNVKNGLVRRSMFSSDTSSSDVSDWDLLAFQMLADDRLKAGMFYNESTRVLLRQIAGELISAWPRQDELEESLKAY